MKVALVLLGLTATVPSACDMMFAKVHVDETTVKATYVIEYEGKEEVLTAHYHCMRRFKVNRDGDTIWQHLEWNGDVIDRTLPDGSMVKIINKDPSRYLCPPQMGKNRDEGFVSVKSRVPEGSEEFEGSNTRNDIKFEWTGDRRPNPSWVKAAHLIGAATMYWTNSPENPTELQREGFGAPRSTKYGNRIFIKSVEFRRVDEPGETLETLRTWDFDPVTDMVRPICRRNDLLGMDVRLYGKDSWSQIKPLAAVLETIKEPVVLHPDTWPSVRPLYDPNYEDPDQVWRKKRRGKSHVRIGKSRNSYVGYSPSGEWDLTDLSSNIRYFKVTYGQDREAHCELPQDKTVTSAEFAPSRVKLGTLSFDLKDYRKELLASKEGLWIYNPQTEEVFRFVGPTPGFAIYR